MKIFEKFAHCIRQFPDFEPISPCFAQKQPEITIISAILTLFSLIEAQLPLRRRCRRLQITQPLHVVAKIS